MFARSTLRRFAVTAPRFARTLTSFGAFLQATKNQFPVGKGGIRARGRAVGAAWRKLSPAEKKKYAVAGSKIRVVKKKKVARKATGFAKFVKKNMKGTKGSAAQRMRALAKKWKASRN
jgi:hypothetical protein